ncbi:MAG: hypothetical protein HY098_00905 [Nitrospinae bacterium]|nr:hypothetical protein [Nitrospinota bacterium]
MNGLREILAETGGDLLVRGFYGIIFFLLAVRSLVALVNHMRLELAARKGFRERSLLMRAFFEAYDKRKTGLEEAERERKRAADAAKEKA